MNEYTEILTSGRPVSDIISHFKTKAIELPKWSDLVKLYEPTLHKICKDTTTRKDKTRTDGSVDIASRIYLGLEKLLVSRYTSFTFGIPPKRIYHNTEGNETRKAIAKALEAIYKHARIDNENIKRGKALYAACEIFTMWYTVESENTLYGFKSKYKLKCKTYSPKDGVSLYPLFDDKDDMVAMSFEYKRKELNDYVTYFETYTADKRYKWKQQGEGWETVTDGEPISILKIPGVYGWRPVPVYDGLSYIRDEIEYTLSRNSDVIAYNSAPILKVAGEVQGFENKGEGRRMFRVQNGGDVSYVSWSQANEALKYHVDTLLNMFFMQSQMPDISFENMKGLGDIGYDARMALLTDAHLKIGEEAGMWVEFLERECNVIKAFLKEANTAFAKEVDNVEVEHIITPYIQNDTRKDIDNAIAAGGGKPVVSHLDAIKMANLSNDPDETLKQIRQEDAEENAARINSIIGEGAV
jgi:hypothetical protein